jgi:glycosyltransferase involved in cell wall biosynthesis
VPKFSIVIPTRNRAYTLYYTLKTCLNQYGFDDYEIVVSDNCSEDNTAEMIKELNSDKIKYFKTDCVLAMTDNFNFAMSKAIGEYVSFIGSDDAIHSHGLYLLDKIISITREKIVSWLPNCYNWPDYIPHLKNILSLQKKNINIIINAREHIRKMVNELNFDGNFPNIYTKAVVHKSLINDLINKTGFVFDSIGPDAYFGFAISAMIDHYTVIGIPICLAGFSGKCSTGASIYGTKPNSLHPITNELVKLYTAKNRIINSKFSPVGIVSAMDLALTDDFTCAKKNLNIFNDIDINLERLLNYVINERYLANRDNGNAGKENFRKELDIIRDVIENTPEYKASFSSKSLNINDYEFYEPIYARIPRIENDSIKIDASLFGIDNIYDATLFAEKLLYSKEYIDAYLNQFEINYNKVKSNSEWLNKYKKMGIFAIGKYTELFLSLYKHFMTKDTEIVLFDNDKAKWETKFYGYKVLPPKTIPEQKLDILIICNIGFQNEIYESVKKYEQTMEIIKLHDKFSLFFS